MDPPMNPHISINTLAEIKAYNNFINDGNQAKKKERISKNSNEKKSFNEKKKEKKLQKKLCVPERFGSLLIFFVTFSGYIQINLMITGGE